MRRRFGLAAAAIAAAMVGATTARAAPAAIAWVEMTGASAEVRTVADGTRCPSLTVNGHNLKMSVRADAADGFDNRVCQASLPHGVTRAVVAGQALPLPKRRVQRMVILGDTGCRLKGPVVQACNDPAAGWPFAKVARLAAAQHPDLVVHVGDYYYRETKCPAGREASCGGSPSGDAWASWKADLFDPAQPLFAAAPWVFARGNHEDCARGGKGWFRLLDADAKVRACPAGSDSFLVPIGGLSLGVVDSADGDDTTLDQNVADAFGRGMAPLLAAKAPVWLVTHRPFWEVKRKGDVLGDANGNVNEQAAAKAKGFGPVALVLAGHLHTFYSLDFGAGGVPPQLVVGTGGDRLESDAAAKIIAAEIAIDGRTATTFNMDRFGYVVLDRTAEGWEGVFRDLDDKVVARCAVTGGRLSCQAA